MDTKKMLFLSTKVILGTLMIIFGLNKFFGFIAIDPPGDAAAQAFLGSMFSSYLFKAVALTEIIGGIFLLIPRFAFLGTLLLTPILFNIAAFHIAHDMPGNGIWLVPSSLFLVICYFFNTKIKNIINS